MAEVSLSGVSTPTDRSVNTRAQQTATLRASAATTTSYVASSHVRVGQFQYVSLDFILTWVDSTSTEWYVEWSQDGTTWYRSLDYAVSGGTITATLNSATIANAASANWNDGPIAVQDVYMRVFAKKTGGVGADTLAVTVTALGL